MKDVAADLLRLGPRVAPLESLAGCRRLHILHNDESLEGPSPLTVGRRTVCRMFEICRNELFKYRVWGLSSDLVPAPSSPSLEKFSRTLWILWGSKAVVSFCAHAELITPRLSEKPYPTRDITRSTEPPRPALHRLSYWASLALCTSSKTSRQVDTLHFTGSRCESGGATHRRPSKHWKVCAYFVHPQLLQIHINPNHRSRLLFTRGMYGVGYCT